MFRLVVLLGLVAFCAADECCSAEDRHRVEDQWQGLWEDTESSKIKIEIGRVILLKVVEKYPEAKALFTRVNIDNPTSGEFSAHIMRIMEAVDMSINLLDDADALGEALDHLADQHQVRAGVTKAYFQAFLEEFLTDVPKLIDSYDDMSWRACFTGIINKVASKLQA
jgi:hypothetical protein